MVANALSSCLLNLKKTKKKKTNLRKYYWLLQKNFQISVKAI